MILTPNRLDLCIDIILQIFDVCEPTVLRSCSLVCKAWSEHAQARLARSIAWPRPEAIHFVQSDEQRHTDRMNLVSDDKARKRLLSFIRVLSLTIMDTKRSPMLDDFARYWPFMDHLRELQIRIMSRELLGNSKWNHVKFVLSVQNVRKVCIRPIGVLGCLPARQVLELCRSSPSTIEELCINQGRDACYGEMKSVLNPDIDEFPCPFPGQLKKIILYECSQTLYFLDAISSWKRKGCLSNLHSITVDLRNSRRSDVERFCSFICTARTWASSLEGININVGHVPCGALDGTGVQIDAFNAYDWNYLTKTVLKILDDPFNATRFMIHFDLYNARDHVPGLDELITRNKVTLVDRFIDDPDDSLPDFR